MAKVQHICTGCVPIDATIIEVYTQLISTQAQAQEAAERAEYAAEHAIGKSPYIGENGDWWEWNDEQGVFIDTGVQAQGSIAVDYELSTTSTNPVQNRVITQALNQKYVKPATGIPASDIAPGVIPDVSQFITASVNNLVNYYLKSETYNKTEVDSLIAAVSQFSYEVVASLPTASASTMYKIYLVPSAEPKAQNVKDEYITIRSGSEGSYTYAWEQIGSTAIDLSGYVTTEQLNTALSAYTTTANLTTLLAAKQDVISDLATIRSGAAAGATAYQKPGSGIPKTDLESGVQASLELADSAIQARPMGEIDPTITPADYATKEELDELEAKVDDIEEEIDGQDANYLENMAVASNRTTPYESIGYGCSDFIPYTQGNSVYWKWGANSMGERSLRFYDADKNPITNGYWNGNTAGGSRTITSSDIHTYAPTAAYIRATFELAYKNVATVTTGDVEWTPVDFVPGLSPRVSALEQAVENQQGEIDALEDAIESIDIERIYDGVPANYEQGRINRSGNVSQDSYSEGWYYPADFIPCQQGDVLTWESGENSANGTRCLCLYDVNKAFINDAYWEPSSQPRSITITSTYSTAKYVRFCFKLKKADNTDNTTPLLINDVVAFEVQNYIPGLTPTDEKATEALDKVNQLLPTDTEHGIIGENYPSEVLVVENQLQAKLANRFHFIHISDNHGASFGYAQQYLDYSPAKFLINTGDLVADKFADKDLESFQTITLATEPTKPVYLALGNHDYSYATSRQAVFDAFIAPTNTHNGTAFDKTYYALDFSTEKVKCIVLDMNDGWADADLPNYGPSGNLTWGKMSQTQINWLATQLQDAITNSLDVVIFIHTPPAQVSRFNRIKDFSDTINLDYARNLTFLPGLIDAFINGETASFTYDGNSYSFTFATGGHFVSWVCGHEHGDLCGWMEGHENQFVAVVCRPYADTSKYSGSYDGDKLGVHWNYCTIDAERKSFSVYRMGQQTTIFGTDRVSFRILYK